MVRAFKVLYITTEALKSFISEKPVLLKEVEETKLRGLEKFLDNYKCDLNMKKKKKKNSGSLAHSVYA